LLLLIGAFVLMTVVQVIWVYKRYDSHRLRHFFGLGKPGDFGKFHWKEGVFEGEVRKALSPDYAQKYRWLFSRRNQRLLVLLNVVSWALCLLGAADLSWNLGFATSPFSWWSVLVVIAYLLVRQSVRVLADAPDSLIDERLTRQRDSAYKSAYQLLGWLMPVGIGFLLGVADSMEDDFSFTFINATFVFFMVGFIYTALPSMVLAWRGTMTER
jgi:hypothetical protein